MEPEALRRLEAPAEILSELALARLHLVRKEIAVCKGRLDALSDPLGGGRGAPFASAAAARSTELWLAWRRKKRAEMLRELAALTVKEEEARRGAARAFGRMHALGLLKGRRSAASP